MAKSWYESLEDCEAGGGTLLSLGINIISILLVFLDVLLFCLHHIKPQGRQSTRLLLESSELGSPPPHPQARVSPFVMGGVTYSLAGEWVGIPIRRSGQTLWNSRYIQYVLCALNYFWKQPPSENKHLKLILWNMRGQVLFIPAVHVLRTYMLASF